MNRHFEQLHWGNISTNVSTILCFCISHFHQIYAFWSKTMFNRWDQSQRNFTCVPVSFGDIQRSHEIARRNLFPERRRSCHCFKLEVLTPEVMKPFKFFTNTQHWQYCQFWPQRLYYMKPKKIQWQNVTTSEDWTQASSPLFLLHLWFKVQHSPLWANLACATWGSLNVCYCTTWFLDLDYLVGINRARLYKERKSSILQANAKLAKKRECWTWNQRLIRGLGSIPTGVTFY